MGKKLLAFAHYDMINRTRLLNMRPVYGLNLRQAVKVTLLLSADLFETGKRHRYVDRRSKFSDTAVKDCFRNVPSAVFNQFASFRSDDERYDGPRCTVTDIIDDQDDIDGMDYGEEDAVDVPKAEYDNDIAMDEEGNSGGIVK